MKVYDHELENWFRLRTEIKAPALTSKQLSLIDFKAKSLLKQTQSHIILHNFQSVCLILTLLITDIFVFSLEGTFGLMTMTFMHGFILYSLTVYTMHEGAGHKRIILGSSFFIKKLAFIVNNVSRLFFADPTFYARNHPSHHQHLASKEDKAFTQLVDPKRIFKSMLPGAGIFEFNDYKIHSGDDWTLSKIASLVIGLLYSSLLLLVAHKNHNPIHLVLILLIVSPWISFTLDRLRESTEHLMMRSDDLPEAREIGNSFWGYLIGGGPWGQPCHLSHHFAPALPWYQQLRLSAYIKEVLTADQRSYFFVGDGLIDYPKMFFSLMKQNSAIFRGQA